MITKYPTKLKKNKRNHFLDISFIDLSGDFNAQFLHQIPILTTNYKLICNETWSLDLQHKHRFRKIDEKLKFLHGLVKKTIFLVLTLISLDPFVLVYKSSIKLLSQLSLGLIRSPGLGLSLTSHIFHNI